MDKSHVTIMALKTGVIDLDLMALIQILNTLILIGLIFVIHMVKKYLKDQALRRNW
jgi:hypothetical protein